MRHQVELKVNIYLPTEHYENDKELIGNRIDMLKENITELECQLKMYASANPKDITPKDWDEESIRWIGIQIDTIMESIYEYSLERDNLETYLEQLNNN